MQNPKSTEPQIKSTENIFTVDFKSTAKFHKTFKTRTNAIFLFQNPKKINIDQL